MSSVERVAERLNDVRARVRAACARSGRDPASVELLGISKRQPISRVREALDAGLRVLGENQIQEAVAKSAELPVDVVWHFVGHLQSNKVKAAVRLFDAIHSIDRLKIARRLDLEAARQDKVVQGFIQVNLGNEPSKSGYPLEGLFDAIKPLADLEHLQIVGLMALPPYEDSLDEARGWFRKLRELRDEMASRNEWHGFQGLLSMGMSHDFETAIEEGATHVRVGTSIFGRRPA
ncbi:MAG: YggS family pyridoxal phosphate-dependent enzyme [Acidobacteriota bacterium]